MCNLAGPRCLVLEEAINSLSWKIYVVLLGVQLEDDVGDAAGRGGARRGGRRVYGNQGERPRTEIPVPAGGEPEVGRWRN
jgi:hypothetical protein